MYIYLFIRSYHYSKYSSCEDIKLISSRGEDVQSSDADNADRNIKLTHALQGEDVHQFLKC